MEIMANSDNVLRGGLTPKHIDVKELLEHVRYKPTVANIITGKKSGGEEVFETPADDFQLSRIVVRDGQGESVPAVKTDIFFVYSGNMEVTADDEKEHFNAGEAFLAMPGTVVHFASVGESVIFRATEPVLPRV